jgi:membrane-bound serine protease (ClpP class)
MRIRPHILIAVVIWVSPVLRAADVGMIEFKGAIAPAAVTYISRAIDIATAQNDACLIIQLDTPGGLVDSTREIVEKFYASRVPIVVYVAPAPARAASAGTFITMAADIAAMAPYTTIGAAHPVSLGFGSEEETNSIMLVKSENDVASFVINIAKKRGRNADWAESAVRKSLSITAEKALDLKVIDLIAKDVPDLLKQIDGREVGGKTLNTADARVVQIPMTVREKFLLLFLRPEIMFVLMLVVMYGIIGELSSPGAILPGVAGGIALILVLYLSAILPVSVAGLVLIGLAIALFIVDVFAPTHGVLTGGGIIAFFLGALMLFDRSEPAFRLSLAYIIPATVLTAAFFIFVVGAGLRAQFLPVRAGKETMLGKTVAALVRIDANGGKVFVEGEYWNAVSETPIEPGQTVEIAGIDGLTLKVKPKQT